MKIRKWRKLSWAIWAWCLLMLAWCIDAIASADPAGNCAHERYLSTHACESASNVGTGAAVGVICFVWFVGFLILSIIWFMRRPREVIVVGTATDAH